MFLKHCFVKLRKLHKSVVLNLKLRVHIELSKLCDFSKSQIAVIIRGGKSMKIFYSSKSTITLMKMYLSTSKITSLKIYSSKK